MTTRKKRSSRKPARATRTKKLCRWCNRPPIEHKRVPVVNGRTLDTTETVFLCPTSFYFLPEGL